MFARFSRRTRLLSGVCLGLALVVMPYLYSRVTSPRRAITTIELSDVELRGPLNAAHPLRMACYNIAHGRGTASSNWNGGDPIERMNRLEAIGQVLADINADIVVLNEVDFDCSWSNSVNQARYLARRAGYRFVVEQRNVDFRILLGTWRFGNAVLSKYPITDAQRLEFPDYLWWETLLAGKKRGAICDIDTGEQQIRLIGSHLSHRSEALRVQSAEKLIDVARGADRPTFIAGDLNSTPPDFPHAVFDSQGRNAIATLDASDLFQRKPQQPPGTDAGLTFRIGHELRSVIDWILIASDWDYLQHAVAQSRLSDHRPVWVDVVPRDRVGK